ncbi:unnamed protein product, partial [Mesorhabditis belari]|uniref:CHHC U11-48K-type domain-containing protein n=1 Tax=Mesorhabditis belari TaxID=2138241 RepID=A0AAF3EEP0_9BILA
MEPIRFFGVDEKIEINPTRNVEAPLEELQSTSREVQQSNDANTVVSKSNRNDLFMVGSTAVKMAEKYPAGMHAQCPYNQEHTVLPAQVYHHLARCRADYMKNNPGFMMIRCRYNGRHYVPDKEIDFHEHTCDATLYKRTMTESKVEPRRWIIPTRKDDKQECLDMDDELARFQAREYVMRMGARRTAAEDESDDSEDETICDYAPPDVITAIEEKDAHSDDSDENYTD